MGRRTAIDASDTYIGAYTNQKKKPGSKLLRTKGMGVGWGTKTAQVIDEADCEGGWASGAGVRSGMAGADVEIDLSGNTRESVDGEARGVGKRMSVGSLLLKRVRYFTDGAVIGSKVFVERVFESNRGRFPEGRKHASRPWRDPGNLEKRAEFRLHTLKDLRVDIYRE